MGLILDSSVVIAAERRGDTVEKLIEQVISVTGDQDAALSSVGLTELVHGIYRAQTQAMRLLRQSFIDELLSDLTIYPYTKATALLAGKDRRRAAGPGCDHSLWRPAGRRHGAGTWLPCLDRQSPPLPAHPWPQDRPAISWRIVLIGPLLIAPLQRQTPHLRAEPHPHPSRTVEVHPNRPARFLLQAVLPLLEAVRPVLDYHPRRPSCPRRSHQAPAPATPRRVRLLNRTPPRNYPDFPDSCPRLTASPFPIHLE